MYKVNFNRSYAFAANSQVEALAAASMFCKSQGMKLTIDSVEKLSEEKTARLKKHQRVMHGILSVSGICLA